MIHSLVLFAALALAPADAPAGHDCREDLQGLLAPGLSTSPLFKGFEHIRADIPDPPEDGAYSARLFIIKPLSDPGNPNTDATVGWLKLDTHAMRVFDITQDPDHPVPLQVDPQAYRRFVQTCLHADR